MCKQWYVLQSKPHKERQVASLLGSRNLEVFLPLLRCSPVNPRAARERLDGCRWAPQSSARRGAYPDRTRGRALFLSFSLFLTLSLRGFSSPSLSPSGFRFAF